MRALLLVALLPSLARAAGPAVAVMPFKDLSGSRNAVGEAIRETVTSDLKEVPGLRVIERAAIDKIILEQNLAAKKFELTDIASVRVGTLVGASLLVTGAYQQAASNVRITARFVKVETGEIAGSAKVDGRAADFLQLQDRVTVALLQSAGIEKKHQQKFAERARPKLKSLKPLEIYGDAVVQDDDGKKIDLLRQAVAAEPTFTYAARDLDALEKRLRGYDAASERAGRADASDLERRARDEPDPRKRAELQEELFNQLIEQRRFRRLLTIARPIDSEDALIAVLVADRRLWHQDAFLADGERFLKKYPRSKSYKQVREDIDDAIERRRHCEKGAAALAGALQEAAGDVCKIADAHDEACHHREARDHYLACLKTHPRHDDIVLTRLVWMHIKLGDWRTAEKTLKQLEATGSHWYGSLIAGLEHQETWPFPVDD
jgi:TolB-like protein